MSEDRKPFTITDRRHFTAEGEARAEAEAPSAAEPPKPEATSPKPEAASPKPERRGAEPREMDFAGFLLTLGAQASALLGAMSEGKEPGRSLLEARSIISILEMLKDKTEGRRTREEDEILEGLLYQLRLAYVERSRVDAP